MNTLLNVCSGYAYQVYEGMQDVIKSLDLDNIDDREIEESEITSSVNISNKLHERKSEFPFPVVYQAFTSIPENLDALKKQVEDYNYEHSEKLKIVFGDQSIPDKGYPVWIGYSAAEFNSLCSMSDCNFLCNYFFHFKGSIFQQPEYQSLFYGFYVEKKSLQTLRDQYKTMSITSPSTIQITLPTFDNFTGSASEIREIISALLEKNEGMLIGEMHNDHASKQLLKDQMQNLSDMGVKILFLKHCCYDTLQPELDECFKTKQASSFLKKYLENGCGGLDGSFNYYDIVKSAVDAGIRPIGLERSTNECFDHTTIDCFSEASMLEFNIGAQEIIQKNKKEGKYVALVDSNHLSYHQGIAGVSELCGIPCFFVQSDVSISKNCFQKEVKNLGISKEICENVIQDHFVHVKVIFAKNSEDEYVLI